MTRDLSLRFPKASFDSLLLPMITVCEVGTNVSGSKVPMELVGTSSDHTGDADVDSGGVEVSNNMFRQLESTIEFPVGR
jgi:hypothetical protein